MCNWDTEKMRMSARPGRRSGRGGGEVRSAEGFSNFRAGAHGEDGFVSPFQPRSDGELHQRGKVNAGTRRAFFAESIAGHAGGCWHPEPGAFVVLIHIGSPFLRHTPGFVRPSRLSALEGAAGPGFILLIRDERGE